MVWCSCCCGLLVTPGPGWQMWWVLGGCSVLFGDVIHVVFRAHLGDVQNLSHSVLPVHVVEASDLGLLVDEGGS